MEIPNFDTIKEKIEFVKKNKSQIIAAKKAQIKFADGIAVFSTLLREHNPGTSKAMVVSDDVIKVRAIINTTNWMDSHDDVHIPGLWSKSLSENKMIMHLQEHKMQFDKIISDGQNLNAFTKTYDFRELGYDIDGTTQALVFDSIIEKDRNPYMFEQYKQNRVNNHSVGMQYVKLLLAVNSSDFAEEKEIWDIYYPQIANKERADENGLFWVVKEAKVIEGSAVPIGSNTVTPTLEPVKSTPTNHDTEPPEGTQRIDFNKLTKCFEL